MTFPVGSSLFLKWCMLYLLLIQLIGVFVECACMCVRACVFVRVCACVFVYACMHVYVRVYVMCLETEYLVSRIVRTYVCISTCTHRPSCSAEA